MLHGIWLVIKLGQEIMPTDNITKFNDDPSNNIQVTERTRFILANLANSRAITPRWFMGSGWLTWPRDYANKQYHKVWWWSTEKYSSYRATLFILANLANSRTITHKVLYRIWLVIELSRDILPTNIFTKFDDYTMKTI